MRISRIGSAWLAAQALALAAALVVGTAEAADAPPNSTASSNPTVADESPDTGLNLDEVTVTARRRTESIVDVPLAITVVSAAEMDKLDIRSTADLADYVPGLEFNDYTPGYARNDRGGARALVFRGLALGLGSSSQVTNAGSMFLDGAAIPGNEIPGSMDVGAVEVLRGPQSVYFGRSAMTGAVSYRTKSIPTDTWAIDTEANLGQRDERDFEASAAGPIVQGLLGARVTGLTQSVGGYITDGYNNGATQLGARSRNSLSGTLEFTPTDKIEMKAYGNYFRDNDGPAATAFIPTQLDNCTPVGASRSSFCGQIPNPSNSINYLNTTIPTNVANAIYSSPLVQGDDFKKQLGLQRNVLNTHFIANWNINDYLRLESITGYHTNTTESTSDGIGQPVTQYFSYAAYDYIITNKNKDVSEELRLSSDPNRPFSWTVGSTFINAQTAYQAVVGFVFNGSNVFFPYFQPITVDKTKTYGYFAGAYYKTLNDKLTLSAEGRYQQDKRDTDSDSSTGAFQSEAANDFTSFNPRLAIDFDTGGGRKVYVSYATGTDPGGFNTTIQTYLDQNNPALTAQLHQYLGNVSFAYAEEKLKIGEIGYKGNFPNGNGFFDLNVYYGKLLNQQVPFGALIPLLGFSVTATENIGVTAIHGLEWSSNYRITHDFSFSTTAAWNYAVRTAYLDPAGLTEFGTTNLSGVKMANAPEYTASGVFSYEHPLSPTWNGYSNLDVVYRGKEYVDAANLAYIPGRAQVNLRWGVTRSEDKLRVEAYIINLLNDTGYTGGSVATDYGGSATAANAAAGGYAGTGYAFFGGTAPPRQFGVRLNYSF